jgi:hypothetical protein
MTDNRLLVLGNAILLAIIVAAMALLFAALSPARAQRCPAGQDYFLNCLPMGGGQQVNAQRAKARYNCAYRRSVALTRARDPRQMRIAAKWRAGINVAGSLDDPDNRSVVLDLVRYCAARGQ